jgi:LysM repeat protein
MSEAADAAEQEYIVQKSDTLISISLKFNMSVQWICEVNSLPNEIVYTGQVLKIKPPGPMERTQVAYNITLKNTNYNETKMEDYGTLTCKSGLLSFTPNDPKRKTLVIDLVTHLQSGFFDNSEMKNEFPFDDEKGEEQSLLVVTYLRDKNDAFTLSTANFCGKKKELRLVYELMLEQAKIVQEKEEFVVPNIHAVIGVNAIEIPIVPEKVPEVNEPPFSEKVPEITNVSPSPEKVPEIINVSPSPEKVPEVKNEPLSPGKAPEVNGEPPSPGKAPKPRASKRERKPVKLIGTSRVLRPEDIEGIRSCFPYHYKAHAWKLLYQLSSDGSSYLSFFEKVHDANPVLCAILTDSGERIGAFVSCGFKVSRNFYGTGETFVFKCQPEFQFYRWQSTNKYFVATSKDEIAIGGGGASALWIGGNFLNAFSEPCPTFGSPSLTSTPNFKILDIEVWKVSSDV